MSGTNKFLLDTNIVVGFLNDYQKVSQFFRDRLINEDLCLSQITRMELLGFPSITPEEEYSINSFISLIEIISLSNLIADKTIQLRRKRNLKLPDAIIAATAIVHDSTLVTCDADLTNSIPELKVINPNTCL